MVHQNSIPNYLEILFSKIGELEEKVNKLSLDQNTKREIASEEKQVFTSQAAAEFLGVSLNTIYLLKASKKISCMKKGKRLYFTRESLLNWLEEGRIPASTMEVSNQEIVKRYLKPRRKKLGS